MCSWAPTSVTTCIALYGHFADPLCHKTHVSTKFSLRKLYISLGIVLHVHCAAHSLVCYLAHQATTDLLENMPLLLGLKPESNCFNFLYNALSGGLGGGGFNF